MKKLLAVITCAAVLSLAAPASALFGFPETLEGTVESIGKTTLTILNESSETAEMVEIQIKSETEFEKATSLAELEEGDLVKIKYKEAGEEKIALSVTKIMKEEAVPDAS